MTDEDIVTKERFDFEDSPKSTIFIFFRDFNAKNVLLRDASTQAERGCGKD